MNTYAFIGKLKTALPLLAALMCLTTLKAFPQKPEIYVQTGHSEMVASIAFSPDGRMLASASYNNTIKLWDVMSGQELMTLKGNSPVAFSPDGRTLASGVRDATVCLWDVTSGQPLKTLKGELGYVSKFVFSRDGKRLASGTIKGPALVMDGSSESSIDLWDLDSGEKLKTFNLHAEVNCLAFTSEGKLFASASGSDDGFQFWDVDSGQEIKSIKFPLKFYVSTAFSPDARIVAISYVDTSRRPAIKIWDVISGKELRTFNGYGGCTFSPDGKMLAASGPDGTIKLWNIDLGTELRTYKSIQSGEYETGYRIAFSSNGKTIAGGHDRSIKLWDVASGFELKTLKGHAGGVLDVAFSPDGKTLASGGQDNMIRLWDLESGQLSKTLKGHTESVGCIAFSPDGKLLASGSFDNTVKLWNPATGRELKTLKGHSTTEVSFLTFRGVKAVVFSPDGKTLASGGSDQTIKLWDVVSGLEVKSLKSHVQDGVTNTFFGFTSLAFSHDGKTLAGDTYGGVELWDIASGEIFKTLKSYQWGRFSPDGKTFVGTIYDSTTKSSNIKLWDVGSWDERAAFKVGSGLSDLVISPDGKVIAAGVGQNTIKLWELASGMELKTIVATAAGVRPLKFSADGKTLASGSADGKVNLWDLEAGNQFASLIALDENEWVVVTPDGRFDGSPDGMKLISYKQDNKLLPLDSFFDQFFTPNLLQRVYARETLPPIASKVDFSKRIKLPPVVRIISPTPGSESSSDTAQIVVQADDQGGGVEDIRLYQNGKLLDDTMRQLTQGTKSNTRTFEVNLLPGVNTFRASAFNTDRTEAVPDELKIELKALEASANLYILAIGLNKYKNENYDLNYGNADAEAFADTVEKRGHGIFKQITKKVIFDADASHGGIQAAFAEIIKKAKPQDVFVFFYAGHGAMSEGDGKVAPDFYLVPYDVVRIFGDSGSLASLGIAAHELRTMLTKIKAQKQLIVLDACQSGGAVETIAMRGPAEEKAIMQLARSAGVAVLASAGQDQTATEFAKLGHGVFTYALLKGLNGEADGAPMDGKVTVKELEAYINDQVPELTKLYRGKRQDPNSSTRGQDFPIAIK